MKLDTEKMIAHKDGAIGWVVFNNPERRNAVSVEMWDAIPVILEAFEQDPEVRVVALKGAGDRAFVAGADISEFETQRTGQNILSYDERAGAASKSLISCEKPTIAMIRGFCIGAGVNISLCCDVRIASDNSRFAIPAARLGLGYRTAGIKNLMDVVGPAFAKEILFTARQFSAAEALDMGLINRVVEEDALEEYARDYCRRIAENAPLTIRAAKEIVGQLSNRPESYDEDRCSELVRTCFESEDYTEGRRAFMEKRKPIFKGR
jgi:enoyl-CoA hydratase/carnithine racemase